MRALVVLASVVVVAALAACGTNDTLTLADPSATPTPEAQGTPGIGSTTTPGTQVTTSLPPTTAGRLIAVAIGWTGSGTASVTDDAGNAYTEATTGATAGGNHVSIFYAKNIIASQSPVVTFTLSVAGLQSILAQEYSGLSSTSPFDGNASASGTGTAPDSGTYVPGHYGDVVFGAAIHDGVATASVGSGFALVGVASNDGTTHAAVIAESKKYSGSSATKATFSLSTSDSWAAICAGFRPSGSGGDGGA